MTNSNSKRVAVKKIWPFWSLKSNKWRSNLPAQSRRTRRRPICLTLSSNGLPWNKLSCQSDRQILDSRAEWWSSWTRLQGVIQSFDKISQALTRCIATEFLEADKSFPTIKNKWQASSNLLPCQDKCKSCPARGLTKNLLIKISSRVEMWNRVQQRLLNSQRTVIRWSTTSKPS